MIEGISTSSPPSATVNAYLRALGGNRRGQGPSGTHSIQAVESGGGVSGKSELTEEEQQKVKELERRDREVRQHESAHKAAAGSFARGGPSFEFTRGPDGQQYATGGEVQIDTSEVSGDPQATIRKMQQVRRAALSPAQPSGQDRQVAAQAAQAEAKARAESTKENQAESQEAQGGSTNSEFALASSPAQQAFESADQSFEAQPRGLFIDVSV